MNSKEELVDFSIYKIYKDGNIFSIPKNRFLKNTLDCYGYVVNGLKCIDGKKRTIRRNRIIWYYFNGKIPEKLIVNHKDEDKENNSIDNFNLLTIDQNNHWGTRGERAGKAISKAKKGIIPKANPPKIVYQYSLDGKLVGIWPSASVAAKELGFNQGWVSECCRENKQGYGYIWSYHLI